MLPWWAEWQLATTSLTQAEIAGKTSPGTGHVDNMCMTC